MTKRRTTARKVILLMIMSLSRTWLFGQDQCKDILANGIWEYHTASGTTTQTASFLNWFCSKTFSSYSQARDASASLSLPIDGLPVEVGGKYRDSQWSEYRNEVCKLESGQYAYASEFNTFVQTASQSVAHAWEACINRIGTQAWLATTQNLNAFAVQIRRRVDLGTAKFTVEGINVT